MELKKVEKKHKVETRKGIAVLGEIFSLKRPILLLHGCAVQYTGAVRLEIPDRIPEIFDPGEHYRSISFKNSKNKELSEDIFTNPIKSIKSRQSILASPLSLAKDGHHEAPCYFSEVENGHVFVYGKSRIMIGPARTASLASFTTDSRDEARQNELLDILMRIPWIANSGQNAAEFLIGHSEDVTFQPGHSFIVTQTVAESFYIILKGSVGISAEVNGRQVIVDTKSEGCSIGELAFLTQEIRNATVTAKTKVIGLRIMFRDLRKAVERFPDIEDNLWYESAVTVCLNTLHACPQFKSMEEGALKRWILNFDLTRPDESMQGDNSNILPRMFVLVFGAATVSHDNMIERFAAPCIFKAPMFIPEVHIVAFNSNARLMIPKNDCTEALKKALKNPKLRTTSSFAYHKQKNTHSTANDLWKLTENTEEEEIPDRLGEGRKTRFSQLVSLFHLRDEDD